MGNGRIGNETNGLSIDDYGLISDCQSAALVGRDGSIDWYCPGRFDYPSVFARLLDSDGGHWSIRLSGEEDYEVERAYIDDTMVLRTEFRTPGGRATLTDTLSFEPGARGHEVGMRSPHVLLRRVEGVEGAVDFSMEFAPRLEYALTLPLVSRTPEGATVRGGPAELHLLSRTELEVEDTRATADFTVRAGESVDFALAYRRVSGRADEPPPLHLDVGARLEDTLAGWKSWTELHRGYDGPYEEQVRRSTLVLQALTYVPTGAVLGAPTTSLPEMREGANWDYRYSWLRDLSLTLRALWVSACPDEAERFFGWIYDSSARYPEGGQLQIMYGVDGERDLSEHVLDHLEGFRGLGPVRVGNDAWRQRQLDVYGEVADSAYLLRDQLGEKFDDATARLVAALAEQAAKNWREPDSGMWEARDAERHYLSSKVMCWVALDRAIKLAPRLGDRAGDIERWEKVREEIRSEVLERGWSEEVGAYTGAFGSPNLDASVLLMPLIDFLPVNDPRMRSTIEVIEHELSGNGLVHRWKGDENGFLLCTYWLVECLARLGETEKARKLFEDASARANDLGLLAEMADPETGEPFGNFPQAFSHVGLINAAWSLAAGKEG